MKNNTKLKIVLIIIGIVILLGLAIFCTYLLKNKDSYTFDARIEKVSQYNGITSVLVEGLDNNINFKGKFHFSIDKDTKLLKGNSKIGISDIKVGQKISITATGGIMETYPAGLSKVTKVVVIDDKPSKLSRMYTDMIEYLMEQDVGLQSNIKFIAIDFSNFRRPLTENEKAEKYNMPNFNTKEEQQEWERKIKSKPIGEETRREIVNYLKEKYPNIEIKQNTFQELKQQGLLTKDGVIEDGILIHVSSLPELIEENKAKINLTKYRGPLGAYFIEFEMKYENNKWELKSISEAIS